MDNRNYLWENNKYHKNIGDMAFILLALAFLIPGTIGYLLTRGYKVDENCPVSVQNGKNNRFLARIIFIIGGALLVIGLISLLV